MSTITIAITDGMKEWIDRKTQAGEFPDSSAYVSDLIRRDQERFAKIEAMQAAVDAGMASGVGSRSPEELFETARRQARSLRGA